MLTPLAASKELRRAYSTIIDFARAYAPHVQSALLQMRARKGVLALDGGIPTLSLVKAAYPTSDGMSQVAVWVKIQIEDYLDYAGHTGDIPDGRMYELSLIISERYCFLNVLEVEMWLAECKASSVIYGTATPLRILETLRAYVVERDRDIERVEAEVRAAERRERREHAEDYKHYYEDYKNKK